MRTTVDNRRGSWRSLVRDGGDGWWAIANWQLLVGDGLLAINGVQSIAINGWLAVDGQSRVGGRRSASNGRLVEGRRDNAWRREKILEFLVERWKLKSPR